MFLGWVFNALFLAFVDEFAGKTKQYLIIFWILQVCIIGMLFSFPMQGYGAISIALSTLHTTAAVWFIIIFFRSTRSQSSLSLSVAKSALLFFALSSIGPFFLGYLKANELHNSNLYRFTIYFFLHFQYNGFFFFGILSLFLKLIEHAVSAADITRIKYGTYVLIASCIPAYFLSTLWAEPGITFNALGMIAALAQFAGLFVSIGPIRRVFNTKPDLFSPQVKFIFATVSIALTLKLLLQFVSAFPGPALFANEYRSIVIAYLHLVLISVITLSLLGWLIHKKQIRIASWPLYLLIISFGISELLLIAVPWNEHYFKLSISTHSFVLLLFNGLMVLSIALLFRSGLKPANLSSGN